MIDLYKYLMKKSLNSGMYLIDKTFEPFIPEEKILQEVHRVAQEINHDYVHLNPLFLVVLNGAFVFAADLLKNITVPSEITFIKVKSYEGIQSKGQVSNLIGLEMPVGDRHVVVLEDIVDSGHTIQHLLNMLQEQHPASVHTATLLFKPQSLQTDVQVKYVGFKIPPQFVVGYGLDYNGQGRNLRDIYRLKS